jgi:hypothetical protein
MQAYRVHLHLTLLGNQDIGNALPLVLNLYKAH